MADTPRSRRGLRGLTPATADAIIEATLRGAPLKTAAAKAGISETQLHLWIRVGRGETDVWSDGTPISQESLRQCVEFAEKLSTAASEHEAELVARIQEAAEQPDKWGRRDWRAAAWLLNNHPNYRANWHEQRDAAEVEVSGTIAHVMRQMESMTDEQLMAEAAALGIPQLLPGNADAGQGGTP